jgi:PIN domain nuclease of toxin-antitoxin system
MARKIVVLDTSALIYWTLDQARLSAKATQAIEAADSVQISSISIWEIGIKIKRRKLFIPMKLRAYVEKLKLVDRLEMIAVSDEVWIRNLELVWNHKDPADRTIVAQAAILECALITSDKTIRRFYKQTVW